MAAPQTSLVLTMCASGGLMLIFGGLVLLAIRRIELDRKSTGPTSIQLPGGWSLSTHQSAIALFALGVVAMGIAVSFELQMRSKELAAGASHETEISGTVDADDSPVYAYAVIAEQTILSDREFRLKVPQLPAGSDYQVLVRAGEMVDKKFANSVAPDGPLHTEAFHFTRAPGADERSFEPDTIAVPSAFAGGD